jgi:hypothetical protein
MSRPYDKGPPVTGVATTLRRTKFPKSQPGEIMKFVLIIVILAVIVGFVIWMANRRQKPPKHPFVIGQQMAAARQNEMQRLQAGATLPSPLPVENYTFVSGQLDLIDPKPVDLDRALRQSCAEFRKLSPSQRDLFRKSVSMDEFYKLLTFSHRSAVFALREQSPAILEDGFTALAMMERDRVDFRDILVAMSLVYHVAGRLGTDADAATAKTAELATPDVATLLIDFSKRDAASKDLQKSFGYVEVGAGPSIGFAQWYFKPYRPTLDLLAMARDLAACIDQDDYCAESVILGSEDPTVWLRSSGSGDLAEPPLKAATGAATIIAHLKPEKSANSSAQRFAIYLAELPDASSATRLSELSRTKFPLGDCVVAVAEDRLFCLMVARSYVVGVAPYEKGDSLERFRDRVTAILAKHVRSNP